MSRQAEWPASRYSQYVYTVLWPSMKPAAHLAWRERWKRWRSRLQVRMTLAFVGATVISLLLLEIVFGSFNFIFSQHQSLLTIITNGEIFRVLLGFVTSGLF